MKMLRNLFGSAAMCLFPCVMISCAGSSLIDPTTGNVEVRETSTELADQGDKAFRTYRHAHPVSTDAGKKARVMRVANRLERVINLPGANWDFTVFKDKEANAFAVPGGKVGVNTGLLDVARTDGQLAAVLAHEMAHVTSNHAGSRLQRQQAIGVGSTLLGSLLGGETQGENYTQWSQLGGQLVFGLPFSRGQELEADKAGMVYMASAGYDPAEAVTLWENMAKRGGGRKSELLSTHPVSATRISELQKFLPVARQQQR